MILTLHPDTRDYTDKDGRGEIGVADWQKAAYQLRLVFSDHRTISLLPSIRLDAAPGAEHMLDIVDERLAGFADDLGNSIEDAWIGARNAINNMKTGWSEPKHDSLHDVYGGTVLCIASGPSAQHWLPEIRRLQDRCIIVCADSIYHGLVDAGIEPHFVCALERSHIIHRLVNPGKSTKSTLIVPATTDPATVSGWIGRRVWWWQSYEFLYNWLGSEITQDPLGRSAGSMAVAASLHLGAKRVYLIGHDLSRGPAGESHAGAVADITKEGHAGGAARREHFHKDMIIDGQISCQFWNLVRTDLETLNNDYPGRLVCLGNAGLDIMGVPRVDSIAIDGSPAWSMKRTTAIKRPDETLGKTVARDLQRFRTLIIPKAHRLMRQGTQESLTEALDMCKPSFWGDPTLESLYRYVLEVAYSAATVRAHLLADDSRRAYTSAARIAMAAIQPTLAIMESDLCR